LGGRGGVYPPVVSFKNGLHYNAKTSSLFQHHSCEQILQKKILLMRQVGWRMVKRRVGV